MRHSLGCGNPEKPNLTKFHPLPEASVPHHPPLNLAWDHLPLPTVSYFGQVENGGFRAMESRAEAHGPLPGLVLTAASQSVSPRCEG